MHPVTRSAAFIAFLGLHARSVHAQATKQHAVVVFDHRAGNAPRISSQVGSTVTRGGLRLVKVPVGESACFIVERANTLLYGYSMNPEALKGQTSSEASDIAASLASALGASERPSNAVKQQALAAEQAGASLSGISSVLRQFSANPAGFLTPSRDRMADTFTSNMLQGVDARFRTEASKYVAVIAALSTAAAVADEEAREANAYSSQIEELAKQVANIEALRKASSADTSLQFMVAKATHLVDEARTLTAGMSTRYKDRGTGVFKLLRETQTSLMAQAEKLRVEYANAQKNDHLEFCHTLQDARVRLSLVIAPKTPTGNGAVKPDTVASFVAEPENEKDFEIVPALVASFSISGEKSYEVAGDAIREVETRPKFAPSAFMMWRVADRKPYWAAVGTAPGRGKLPDAHLGLVLRLGEEKLKTNLVLGAGLTFAHAATGLDGASVGASLPAGKTLADVTRLGYRWGPTVFLTISGLSIPVGKTTPAASPEAKR